MEIFTQHVQIHNHSNLLMKGHVIRDYAYRNIT